MYTPSQTSGLKNTDDSVLSTFKLYTTSR